MRRADGDALTARDLDPAVGHATAGENERVDAIPLDDGEFEVTAIRRGCDRLPHGFILFCHCRIPRPEPVKALDTSVPIPKFAPFRGTSVGELRNRRALATY